MPVDINRFLLSSDDLLRKQGISRSVEEESIHNPLSVRSEGNRRGILNRFNRTLLDDDLSENRESKT